MKSSLSMASGLAIALLLGVLGGPSADASEVYSYVGNVFTSTYGAPGSGFSAPNGSPCGVSCDLVTISFTVSSPLGDNFSGMVTPTSFSASDGAYSITSANDQIGYPWVTASFSPPYFDIETNASGTITNWAILLAYTAGYNYQAPNGFSDAITSINGISIQYEANSIDGGDAWACNTECDEEMYAGESYTPGVWSNAAVATTPLPATIPLFATGLGAMGLLSWRRMRKNAARVAA
jgi:hypothetical protein